MTVGERCYVDYNVVIESSGAPIVIDDETIIFANSVIRSVGGISRPAFPVRIGNRTLISPLCALAGCIVGSNCYIATAALIFQGATIGDNCRIAAGAIVHLKTTLPAGTNIGLRYIAVPTDGGKVVIQELIQSGNVRVPLGVSLLLANVKYGLLIHWNLSFLFPTSLIP